MDPSFQPLNDLLSTLDFEELGHISLEAVSWPGMDFVAEFGVRIADDPEQRWRVTGRRIRASRIHYQPVHRPINHIWLEEENHPVLLPYTAPETDLYFRGRVSNGDAIVGQLLEAHHKVVGKWFDFDEFLNRGQARSTRAVLEEGGFGLFAKGPQPLIDAYSAILSANGVVVSSPPAKQRSWWDGERWVDATEPLCALFFGDSYVVGAAFTAERCTPRRE
jgi:hypothetical protein